MSDQKCNILLGVTGSVATTLLHKLVRQLDGIGTVRIVATRYAKPFIDGNREAEVVTYQRLFHDWDEWNWRDHAHAQYRDWYKKGDEVCHISLREWADVLVIAPLSANTMAKMTHGICDNLLTSIFLAWDWRKPAVIAPAMNTVMWEADVTQQNLKTLRERFGHALACVDPIEKDLACNTHGIGALAQIDDIVKSVQTSLGWLFPVCSSGLPVCSGIPVGNHPGAFGYKRRHSQHGGVDLYVPVSSGRWHMYTTPQARAAEGGTVVNIEKFTGPEDGSPWWNSTSAVLVEGRSGVICYGEIEPFASVKIGNKVNRGDYLGRIIPVVKEGRERPDIPGHSRAMLHVELYKHGRHEASVHKEKDYPFPDFMMDPTPYLLKAEGAPSALPEFTGSL